MDNDLKILFDKYGDNVILYSNIEAIRQSGKTNMFDWITVHTLYDKHFPNAVECPMQMPKELFFMGLPEDLRNNESFKGLVKRALACINNDIPDIIDEIDADNIMESINELAKEYDLRPSQVSNLKKVYAEFNPQQIGEIND